MKTKKDVKLVDVVDNLEEFLASLPWEREVNSNDISHALKARIKGKVKFNLSSQDRCVKIFMCDVEKTYANKFFTVRISGSERFWNRVEGAMLTKPKPQQKKMTRIIVGGGPVVTEPTIPVEVEEKISEEQPKPVEETKRTSTRKDLPIPSKEDMVKTYFLIELLKSGPIKSALVKSFSDYMGWGKIYEVVNRTLMYYGVKNTIDTSGKRIIKLSPEVKRTDEDINVLTSIIESEVKIPTEVLEFLETGELPTKKKQPEAPLEEEKEEKKEAKVVMNSILSKEDQVKFLKKYIYDSNVDHGLFQSEIFRAVKLLRLDLIKCPQDDLKGKDVRICQKTNPRAGVMETFIQVKKEFYDTLEDAPQKEKKEQPQEIVQVEEEVVKTSKPEQPKSEDIESSKELIIEFYSMNKLDTDISFVSERKILQFWRYGVRIKTKADALNLVKLYYSNIRDVEFEENNDRVLEMLDVYILS